MYAYERPFMHCLYSIYARKNYATLEINPYMCCLLRVAVSKRMGAFLSDPAEKKHYMCAWHSKIGLTAEYPATSKPYP